MNIRAIGWGSIYDPGYRYTAEAESGVYLLVHARTRIRVKGKILPGGTVIVYDGSEKIEYSAADEYLVCDWVSFDGESDAEFSDFAEIVFNQPITNTESSFICLLMRDLTAEYYSVASRRMKIIDFMMKTLLMKIAEAGTYGETTTTVDPHYSAMIELREKIYRNPQLKWNVDTMAADVNMSRSYFQHLYREIFGVSCMTDVISGKIEKAKEILSETSCTVSQVAAMCGYDNEEHFMRQFKKIVGVTPTGYRKKAL